MDEETQEYLIDLAHKGFRAGHTKVDPTKHYQGLKTSDVILSCGFLLMFATKAMAANQPLDEGMKEAYREFAGSGTMDSKEYVTGIDEDGVLDFPDDPLQYPVMSITSSHQICYLYPYAMMAFVNRENNELLSYVRMD